MKKSVYGLHIDRNIHIDTIRKSFLYTLVNDDITDLLYKTEDGGYVFITNYGSVVFIDVNQADQSLILKTVRDLLQITKLSEYENERYGIEIDKNNQRKVLFNKIILDEFSDDIAYTIMVSIAQSVALDYYSVQSEVLLEETRVYTTQLEAKGNVELKSKSLLKYIGKVLNLKNLIAKNLYIFDAPQIMWEDQPLDQLHKALTNELDITLRHRYIQENLSIVQENLELFKDLSQHKDSTFLEWIIIILILIEVVDMFLLRLIN